MVRQVVRRAGWILVGGVEGQGLRIRGAEEARKGRKMERRSGRGSERSQLLGWYGMAG